MCGNRIPQNEECLFCDAHGCDWVVCGGHGLTPSTPLRCPSHMGPVVSRSVRRRARLPLRGGGVSGTRGGSGERGATCAQGTAGGGAAGDGVFARRGDTGGDTPDQHPGGAYSRTGRAAAVSPELPDPRVNVPSARASFFHPHVVRRARFLPEVARNACVDPGHQRVVESGALARARIRVDRYLHCPNRRCLFCCRWARVSNPSLAQVCTQHGAVPQWWTQRCPWPPPLPPPPR